MGGSAWFIEEHATCVHRPALPVEDIDVLALVGAKKCCACKEDPNRKGKCKKDTNGKTSGCGPDCDHEPGYKCWHRLGYIFHDLDCEKYN